MNHIRMSLATALAATMAVACGSAYPSTPMAVRQVAYYDSSSWYYDARTGYYHSPAARYYEAAPRYVPAIPPSAHPGVVDRIEIVRRGDGSNIVGTVIGEVVGGAAVGAEFQRRPRDDEAFRVSVRLNGGAYRTMDVTGIVDLRTGDRVWLDGNTLFRG
jgi:hypothetical protein